ncbi:hypothetical protein C0992_009265 [Termitomyces sp. T32_za158]|nr:hypothetical protein C0992_009265 [Termitomyces sp. T32_za158]
MAQARDTLLHDCNVSLELWEVQAEEIKQLQARLTQEAVESSTEIPGFVAPSAQEVEELAWGLRQVDESESRWLGPGAPAAPGWSVLGHVVCGEGVGRAGNDPGVAQGQGAC